MQTSQTLLPADVFETCDLHCFVARVQVVVVKHGPHKEKIQLFYGRICNLLWDPRCPVWSNGKNFMDYTTQMGRELLRAKHSIPDIPSLCWADTLLASFAISMENQLGGRQSQQRVVPSLANLAQGNGR